MRITAREYAERHGITIRAVRMQLQRGKLKGVKELDPLSGTDIWWIEVPDPPETVPLTEEHLPTLTEQLVPPSAEQQREQSSTVPEEVRLALTRCHDLIEKQQQQLIELAGRVGFYQARIRELERRVLELEAPKEAPADMANHPSAEQNSQGVGAQTDSEMPEEQSEARRGSEVSAFPAVNRQEGSSAGAFKRLWRWLTRPV